MSTSWIGNGRLLIVAPLALAMLVLTGGCQNNRLEEERNALREENIELHDVNAELRRQLGMLTVERDQLAQQVADLRAQLSQARQPRPQQANTNTGFSGIAGVETGRRGDTVYVRVPGDVLFAPGKDALKSTAKSTLSQVAAVLNRQYPGKTIRVEGYTDTDPIRKSKWKDNLELSAARAMSVLRHLASQGVPEPRMYAAAFGEHHPESTKARSRRVEVVVVMNE